MIQEQLVQHCTNTNIFGANAGAADSVLPGECQRHIRQHTDHAASPGQQSVEVCRPLADGVKVAVYSAVQQADNAMTGKGAPSPAPSPTNPFPFPGFPLPALCKGATPSLPISGKGELEYTLAFAR